MESDALPLRGFAFALAALFAWGGACIPGPDDVCRLGASLCDGSCVDTRFNVDHCGTCGQMCEAGTACVEGRCSPACGALQACGDDCAALAHDPRHCGACGVACGAGEICADGICQAGCAGGAMLCGGRCTDVAHDETNCGDCGVICEPNDQCRAGRCECADILTDAANCGTCGNPCAMGSVCQDGQCRPLCFGRPCAPGDTVWGQRMGEVGGPVADSAPEQELRAVTYDANGRLFAAVEARDDVQLLGGSVLAGGGTNLLVLELDEEGRLLRHLLPNGNGQDNAAAMVVDDGELLIVGHYNATSPICDLPPSQGDHDGFVVRIAQDFSACTMVAALSSPGDARFESISLVNDTVALSGRIEGPATLTLADGTSASLSHVGGSDAVLATLDRDGNLGWIEAFGSPGNDAAQGVAAHAEGLVVTGYYQGAFDGLPLGASGQRAMWMAGFDLAGELNWQLGVPVTSSNGIHDVEGVAVARHGGRDYFLGQIRGAVDIAGNDLVSRLGSQDVAVIEMEAGNVVRFAAFGDEGQEEPNGLWVDERGVVITGSFEGRIDFGLGELEGAPDKNDDTFVAAFDLEMVPLWNRAFIGESFERPHAIAGFRGRVTVGGKFRRNIDLGLGPLFAPQRVRIQGPVDEDDAFLATLSR